MSTQPSVLDGSYHNNQRRRIKMHDDSNFHCDAFNNKNGLAAAARQSVCSYCTGIGSKQDDGHHKNTSLAFLHSSIGNSVEYEYDVSSKGKSREMARGESCYFMLYVHHRLSYWCKKKRTNYSVWEFIWWVSCNCSCNCSFRTKFILCIIPVSMYNICFLTKCRLFFFLYNNSVSFWYDEPILSRSYCICTVRQGIIWAANI